MPIIKEKSNLEKIASMYYGKSKSKILIQTHHGGAPGSLRVLKSVNSYSKTYPRNPNKFKSNEAFFCVKFNSFLPEIPLKMEEVYLKRQSQRVPFRPKKISRDDLEKILKWGLFYKEKDKSFTVPCGGALYHYEIYLCLFQSHLLPLGLYRYNPQTYTLALIKKGNLLESAEKALSCYLDRLRTSTGVMFFTSDLSESRTKYQHLSERLILLDMGHIMHSMNLAFTAMGYGVSNIGGGKAREIIDFLSESKKSNYIASIYFGGLK